MNSSISIQAFSIKQLLGYARILLWAMVSPRVKLVARLLAAESQLAECKRRIIQRQAPKPRFTNSFKLLWVVQQLREATPFGRQPKYLFRDNDSIYGHGVRAFLGSCGIEEVRTAYRSPWQNPYVERFIGTLRRELLDHVIVLGVNHLKRLLKEYIEDYYHLARPHQGRTVIVHYPATDPCEKSIRPSWFQSPSAVDCIIDTCV
ncbi:integrase core domain-containing protein [Gemmatimonadota bacterium]